MVSTLLLLFSIDTLAQSGRRAPKPQQSPVTTPQPENETRPRMDGRELKHKVSLIVARELSSDKLLSEEAIFSHFVKQLSEFTNVTVTDVGDLKRDHAVKRAKAERDAAVVLVQFDVDEFQAGTIIVNPTDLDVKVLVFAPKTGQKKFEGEVYYKAVGGLMLKRDNWPSGTPIRMTTEAVGIEAAEQVRDWLIVEEQRKKN
ncbi:MAG TPA: hypothetical protein VHH35_15525 [Pyrinomonadaceae bacterium]|nr:hypothetical protein [Pyrinomonadaceae bacterium]